MSNTTPMYRCPEMINLYNNYPINEMQDIWALGCILYTICFQRHPYADSSKLAILNANYNIPKDIKYNIFHPLIKGIFQINPNNRPSAAVICDQLRDLAANRNINPKSAIKEVVTKALQMTKIVDEDYSQNQQVLYDNQQPAEVKKDFSESNTTQQQGSLMNMFRGGASKFVNNIIDTVSTYAKSELDLDYITPKLAVMSAPSDGIQSSVGLSNNVDVLSSYLNEQHSNSYIVFNLISKQYNTQKLNNKVLNCGWPCKGLPSLESLLQTSYKIIKWLEKSPKNAAIIHCHDGRQQSVLLVCSLFILCNIFNNVEHSLAYFNSKRQLLNKVSPSYRRFLLIILFYRKKLLFYTIKKFCLCLKNI